jgi:hypothetical protein
MQSPNQIQKDMIAGHKTAIAALEQSIAAREANATSSYYGVLPFTAISTIHQTELKQLEQLNTELRNMEAIYGKA